MINNNNHHSPIKGKILLDEISAKEKSKIISRYGKSSKEILPTLCRLNNHSISIRRIDADPDGKSIYSIKCCDCGLQWNEVWTTSSWFMKNNYKKKKLVTKKY